MTLLDDLTAPARELLRHLRRAMRARAAGCAEPLKRLRCLLAVEERWLYPELARAVRGPGVDDWPRFIDRQHGMSALIEQLLRIEPHARESVALLSALQSMLARHLRDQCRLLDRLLDRDPIGTRARLARFAERSKRALRSASLSVPSSFQPERF